MRDERGAAGGRKNQGPEFDVRIRGEGGTRDTRSRGAEKAVGTKGGPLGRDDTTSGLGVAVGKITGRRKKGERGVEGLPLKG